MSLPTFHFLFSKLNDLSALSGHLRKVVPIFYNPAENIFIFHKIDGHSYENIFALISKCRRLV